MTLIATRKARHRSQKHRDLTTAQAILAVAEERCATIGPTNIKLAEIAGELGIEPPSIYRHFNGLGGVIGGLAGVALRAEIETFAGIESLPFRRAFELQAERLFDLYLARPGLARFLMVDFAVPGGLQGFENNENLGLVRELYGHEQDLLRRGVEARELRPMSVTSFVAARVGPGFTAIALRDLQTPGSDLEVQTLRKEYLQTVMASLAPATR